MPRALLPANFRVQQPNARLIEDFATVGDWVSEASSGAAAFLADPANKKAGANGLRLLQTGASGGNSGVRKFYTPALNLADVDDFYLWVYAANANSEPGRVSTLGHAFTIYLSSDNSAGTYANFRTVTIGATNTGSLVRGWNLWHFDKSMTAVGAGTLDWSNIRNVRVLMTAANAGPSNPADVTFGGLYIGYRSRPKVILTLDDGPISQYDRILEANTYGIPCTAYIIPSLSESGGGISYLSGAQCKTLSDAGNLVACHGVNPFPAYADAGASEIAAARAFLEKYNCAPEGLSHVAYVGGQYNQAVLDLMKSLGMRTARSLSGIGYTAGPPESFASVTNYVYQTSALGVFNFLAINARSLSAGVSSATVIGELDTAIQRGLTFVLYAHDFVASGATGNQWLNSDWTALLVALRLRMNQGLLDCVTMDEWYRGMTEGSRVVDP